MSDRIREIAREANLRMPQDNALALGYLTGPQKRFARLLLEECVNIITNEQNNISAPQWVCKDSTHIAQKIKDHFGL